MSVKNETKINHRKISVGSTPLVQHSPSTKNQNKTTNTANCNGLKDSTPTNVIDDNATITTNKTTPTKTSRNQVSANWNSVAASLKSQRTIPSSKKNGKIHAKLFNKI